MIRIASLIGSAALLALSACGERNVVLPGTREDIRPDATSNATTDIPSVRLSAQRNVGAWPVRGGSARNTIPHASFAQAPQLIWQASIGEGNTRRQVLSTAPVAANGRIFTRDSGARITAFSESGETIWSRNLTPKFENDNEAQGGGLGIRGNTLYAATGFGELHALDVATGAERWVQKLDAPVTAPTFDGDRLYVVSRDNRAWALNADNGRILWELPASPSAAFLAGTPSPAVTDRLVIFPFGSGEVVGALKRSGVRVWGSSISGARTGVAYGNIGDISADPVIVNNVAYIGTQAGRLVALNARSGERLWTIREGATGPVVVNGGSLFVVNDKAELLRLSARSGERIWGTKLPFHRARRPDRRQSVIAHFGPVLAGGKLWLASSDGLLRGFDPNTGAELSALELPNGGATRPIIMNGIMYVVNARGVLHAYR